MIITTSNTVDNKSLEVLGLVEGMSVQYIYIGSRIHSIAKNLTHQEITPYLEAGRKARLEAKDAMIKEAEKLNADAIIAFRYNTDPVAQFGTLITAYGTAVKFI